MNIVIETKILVGILEKNYSHTILVILLGNVMYEILVLVLIDSTITA